MMKWSNYWKPTTKTMRAVGDTLLGVGTLASSYGIMEGQKDIAIICLGSGVVGKFITNFTSDEKKIPSGDSAADSPADNSNTDEE